MKSIFALVVFSSVVYFVHSAATKDFVTKFGSAMKKCQEDFKVDIKSIESAFMSGKEPENDNEKCAMKCMFNEFSYLKDGKIDLDAYYKTNEMKWPGETSHIEKANKIMKDCSEKTQNAGNDCKYSSSLASCFAVAAKAEGLPLPDMKTNA